MLYSLLVYLLGMVHKEMERNDLSINNLYCGCSFFVSGCPQQEKLFTADTSRYKYSCHRQETNT